MDSWEVIWADSDHQERRQEFATYLEAWDFNEQTLGGRGEVVLLTERAGAGRAPRSESDAVRKLEGAPRRRNRS